MKFTRKELNLGSINITNAQDKCCTKNKFIITVAISNTINPTFLVYADDEQDALNKLAVYCDDNELSLFIDYYELVDVVDDMEERETYFQAENGLYADLSYFNIKEVKK